MFLVVLETAKSEVELELEKTDLSIKVNVITIPCDADWGTADSLRHLSPYIIVSIQVLRTDFTDVAVIFTIRSTVRFHRREL